MLMSSYPTTGVDDLRPALLVSNPGWSGEPGSSTRAIGCNRLEDE